MLPPLGQPIRNEAIANPEPDAVAVAFGPPVDAWAKEKLPDGEQWIAQVKWDGVRILTYFDGHSVRLFNRRRHERTKQFPELLCFEQYGTASSAILDGEVIALRGGKPSFHEVMKRDSLRNVVKLGQARRAVPIVYMVFDILYHNGLWVTDRPLRERQQILAAVLKPSDDVRLVENFAAMDSLFEAVVKAQMEGIVCKDLNSTYKIGGKDERWQKRKNYRDVIAVIGGARLNGGAVAAVLLGLYDELGRLVYIGQAGTGRLTQSDWRQLTGCLKALAVAKSPFASSILGARPAVWVRPVVTVKVRFLEWTDGGLLRQPSIQAVVDVLPTECCF